jgi:hypothetical protein
MNGEGWEGQSKRKREKQRERNTWRSPREMVVEVRELRSRKWTVTEEDVPEFTKEKMME